MSVPKTQAHFNTSLCRPGNVCSKNTSAIQHLFMQARQCLFQKHKRNSTPLYADQAMSVPKTQAQFNISLCRPGNVCSKNTSAIQHFFMQTRQCLFQKHKRNSTPLYAGQAMSVPKTQAHSNTSLCRPMSVPQHQVIETKRHNLVIWRPCIWPKCNWQIDPRSWI